MKFCKTGPAGLCLAGLMLASAAAAADRKVDITNQTGLTLKHFYASRPGADTWEDDILGRDTLGNGQTFQADIDDGSGSCVFDFKAVFEDGQSLIRKKINVCEISAYTYSR